MMKKIIFSVLVTSLSFANGFSQQSTDLRELFLAAESYFLFEEFNEALPLYLRIHREYPENDNINYKIGVCFLNNPYEKDKAITYLKEASDNITRKYKENNFKETSAPPEVLYYLGNAYLINNEIDEARKYYNQFLETMDTEVYDRQLVIDQLEACDAAEKLMQKPIDFDRDNLSGRINTRFADMNPVISGDESKMAFISKLQFYDAVFYTEKVNGQWLPPRNIVPELGVDGDVYPTSMSYDGKLMYIYRSDNFIGNLYYTKLVDGKWTPLVKLNDNINTKFWESHASETKDGKHLYFSSNRKGGSGGLDIYRSDKMANGEWGPPVNLGPVVNSKYNDDTPFITATGDKLYFSSYGHYNMGGYDIFMTKKTNDGSWAEPVNIGYPINTTDDDQFFNPIGNGEIAYFPRYVNDGFGRTDIYRYEVYSPDNPRTFEISGLIDYMGNKADSSEIYIAVVDKEDRDTVTTTHPGNHGNFTVEIPAGDYDLIIDSDRFKRYMRDLEVSQNTPHEGFILPGTIALELKPPVLTKEEEDKKLKLLDSLIVVDEAGKVKVRFNAERGSDVKIEVTNEDSEVLYSDSLQAGIFRQSFEFEPDTGRNKVVVRATDDEGRVVEREMEVVFNPSDREEEDKITTPPSDTIPESITAGQDQVKEDSLMTAEEAENLEYFKENLEARAEGALKKFLEELDLEEEGITSREELIKYLYDNAEKGGYSTADVDDFLRNSISVKDLSEFIADMKRVSTPELRKTLDQIDPEAENIHTPRELIDHLLDESATAAYEDNDVISALSELASQEDSDPSKFLKSLIRNSEGDLHNYLGEFDLQAAEIDSSVELGVEIYRRSLEGEIDKTALLDLLTKLAVAKPAEELRKRLAEIAEGDLKALLDSLDLEAANIHTAEELIDFLYENKYDLDYTKEDVDRLLSEELYRKMKEIDEFREKLAGNADGELKEYLENYDIREGRFTSREDFIDFLKKESETEEFSLDDIQKALLKMAFDGDVEDLILKFTEFALGDLHQYLLTLDPEAEGITTTRELIENLLINTNTHGYDDEDVVEMLSKYSSSDEVSQFLEKLKRLAGEETKEYLNTIDPFEQGLETKQDLIDKLLEEADDGKVDREEMVSIILQAEDLKAEEVIPALQSIASQDMQSVLNEIPDDIATADELLKYLLEQSDNEDFSREDVLDLFSDYLRNLDVHEYYQKFKEHAEGNLGKMLEDLDVQKEGIENVEEFIKYLLKNSEKGNYNKEDVYHTIADIINQLELEDFIERLKSLAAGGLLEALNELDLAKMNIGNVNELIEYLLSVADKYGFDPAYLWDLIMQMALGEDAGFVEGEEDLTDLASPAAFRHSLKYAGAILIFAGLLIFVIILIARRRKRKKDEEQEK